MIKIYSNNSFTREKQYVFNFVFADQLCLDYELEFGDYCDYKIVNDNKSITIRDCFFSKFRDDEKYYLDIANIPSKLVSANIPTMGFDNLPIIFGDDELKYEADNCFCGNDIFAGIYFMLTRWEEIAIKDRDRHDRVEEKDLLSIRFNFYKRPIVNEYIHFLRGLIESYFGFKIDIQKKFKAHVTHDVDDVFRYKNIKSLAKACAGDLLKRKSVRTAFKSIGDYYQINFKSQPDVWDRFDYLMNLSETNNLRSSFYFIPGKIGEYDVRFDIDDPNIIAIIKKILSRGHTVGIHPSYSSYCNLPQLKQELLRLKKYTPEISEGRQHYLRFKNPMTWNDWADAGLKIDSSIGFASVTGFRAGVCCEYKVFDVVARHQIDLVERPLIVMDTALRVENISKEKSIEAALLLLNQTKKYDGDFVLLWHNNNLSINEWESWSGVYSKIVSNLKTD